MKSFRFVSHWILLGILGMLLLSIAPALAQTYQEKVEKDQAPEITVGQLAPDFTATDLDGTEFTLSSMLGIKPVVLDFWATWCPPCRRELPFIKEFDATYGDQVLVYCITSEAPEDLDTITKFLSDNDYHMKVIHDSDRTIGNSYYANAIPYLVVIGVDGKVLATHLGYSEETDVVGELVSDLNLEPPAQEQAQ